jgi:hypothetical protein
MLEPKSFATIEKTCSVPLAFAEPKTRKITPYILSYT